MKKPAVMFAAVVMTFSLLTGCGKVTPLLSAVDYELDLDTNTTNKGVSVGDTPEAFLAAYGEYRIFTSVNGGEYQVFPTEEIPFGDSLTCLLPTFFIDGLPVDPDAFCEENEIEKSALLAFLTSDDYLQSHTVVYYYLTFTWEDGVISEITSRYMDYNEDASYYMQ